MPGSAAAEVYFIAAMMILILIICAVAVFAFFKTYKKEKRDRENRIKMPESERGKSSKDPNE